MTNWHDNCENNHGEYRGSECPSCADGIPDWESLAESFSTVEIISKDKLYMCEWEWIGEGDCGDFDASDPDDRPLLRFTICKWQQWSIPENDVTGEWEAMEDASYCTRNDVNTSIEHLQSMGEELIYEARRADEAGVSWKKTMEAGSWIVPAVRS